MRMRMTLLAGVAALSLSPLAYAQENTPTTEPLLPPAQEAAPAEQAPIDNQTPAAEAPTPPADEATDDATGIIAAEPVVIAPPPEALITTQRPNEVRSGNLIGATVITSEGEEVGKVKEILLDTSGTATGMVLSVGGIMGLGAKDVGLAWQEIDMRPEADEVVRINYTKAQLEAAPSFQTQEALQAEQNRLSDPAAGSVPPAPAPETTE